MAVAKSLELGKILSSNKVLPFAVLVHGADRSAVLDLCKESIKRITGSADDPLSVSLMTEAQVMGSRERLYEAFASISMFGSKHVIWVSDAGDSLVKVMEPILSESVAGNLIIVDAESLAKTSKLRKLFEVNPRCVAVALYEESTHELRMRLEKQVKSGGFEIVEEAMRKLLEFISYERAVGSSEAEKLMLYCHGKATIDVEDVEAICGDTSEASSDELVDAVFGGNLLDTDRFASAAVGGRSNLSPVLQHVVKLQAMAAQLCQNQSIETVVNSPRFGIFFKRKTAISLQLKVWDIDALLNAEEKVNAAILQTRQYPDLENAIISRTLLALSRSARNR
jgi:DNA polymerase III subunit delta